MKKNPAFRELCKANGWKCTPQRLIVYTFMEHNLNHPSVDQVWEYAKGEIPAITRESIYRILNEFSEAGILHRMDKIESAHYDSRRETHGHLICERCGKIADYSLANAVELPPGIPAGEICYAEVRVSWICPECRDKK